MPVWGAVALALGVALVTHFGTGIIQWRQREHDRRRRRIEEWHRNVRWAVELIASGDDNSVVLGVGVLDALDNDDGLEPDDQRLIEVILLGILYETEYGEAIENPAGASDCTPTSEYDGAPTSTDRGDNDDRASHQS